MSIQSKFGAGLLWLCALYIPCSVAEITGDPSVYATWTDDITQGDWVNTYGKCYSVLPQASPRLCVPEIAIGPDFEGPNPGQYQNIVPDTEKCDEVKFLDALCISGDAQDNFDVRLFVKGEAEAFVWGFDDSDIAENAAQYNGCLSEEAGEDVYYPSTFDSDNGPLKDPLSGEIWLDKGGDAIIAYYFLTEETSCRSQSYELFVNGDSIASGKVTEFNSGQYLVFDIRNIPDDSRVRLETAKLPIDDPDACDPDLAPNSHMSGIFVNGTDACAVPSGEGCTPGFWKNLKNDKHLLAWGGISPNDLFSDWFDDAFTGMKLKQVLRQGGGGLRALGRHTVAALLNANNGDIAYGMTVMQVQTAFNDLYPATGENKKAQYNALKNTFQTANESGCPINGKSWADSGYEFD